MDGAFVNCNVRLMPSEIVLAKGPASLLDGLLKSNDRARESHTPLMLASCLGHFEWVAFLVSEKGASLRNTATVTGPAPRRPRSGAAGSAPPRTNISAVLVEPHDCIKVGLGAAGLVVTNLKSLTEVLVQPRRRPASLSEKSECPVRAYRAAAGMHSKVCA